LCFFGIELPHEDQFVVVAQFGPVDQLVKVKWNFLREFVDRMIEMSL
jgi:hypothetical protein